jgi:hypothetical protein
MTAHAPPDLHAALLHWIDRSLRFDPDASRWPLEARGLRRAAARNWREYIVGELWHCAHTLPDRYCDSLEMTRGSTYAEAVRKIWCEHLGEEQEPAT